MLCQCSTKLSPLQSRFLASVAALALLAVIYWSLSDAHFAYAAELEFDGAGNARGGEGGQDHNWHRLLELLRREDEEDGGLILDGVSISTRVEERQATASIIAGNDVPNADKIQAGNTTVWRYPTTLLNETPTAAGPGLPANLTESEKRDAQHLDLRKRDGTSDEKDVTSELDKRQSTTTVYISINTCLQPSYIGPQPQLNGPAQLTLYISTSTSNTSPGPNGDSSSQVSLPLDEGFAQYSLSSSTEIYMSISAPALGADFTGAWHYALAVSLTDFYHQADTSTSNLFLVDSDDTAALLVTQNLTESNVSTPNWKEWMNLSPPFTLYASNTNHTSTLGLQNSFCGLNTTSQFSSSTADLSGSTTNVQTSITDRGLGTEPKQQFYLQTLNASSTYLATLAEHGNSTAYGSGVVGGGGKVWRAVPFSTKSDQNCALLFNLTFCNQVAYAVPSNPQLSRSELAFLYDNYTSYFYQNFNYSLQQIPCNTTRAAQYSLARNCDDCASAYKSWLCAVSIPRCEDFSSTSKYLQRRAMGQPFLNGSLLSPELLGASYTPMPDAPTIEGSVAFQQTYGSSIATNQSRNVMIDQQIRPGPYKEVLPCEDLCYNLVQSCPAALGFTCPYPGRGLEAGYGSRIGNGNGSISCSYLGAVIYTSAAAGGDAVLGGMGRLWVVVGLTGWMVYYF